LFAHLDKADKILDDYLNYLETDEYALLSSEYENLNHALIMLRQSVMGIIELNYPRENTEG
jgi:hypothetical protein